MHSTRGPQQPTCPIYKAALQTTPDSCLIQALDDTTRDVYVYTYSRTHTLPACTYLRAAVQVCVDVQGQRLQAGGRDGARLQAGGCHIVRPHLEDRTNTHTHTHRVECTACQSGTISLTQVGQRVRWICQNEKITKVSTTAKALSALLTKCHRLHTWTPSMQALDLALFAKRLGMPHCKSRCMADTDMAVCRRAHQAGPETVLHATSTNGPCPCYSVRPLIPRPALLTRAALSSRCRKVFPSLWAQCTLLHRLRLTLLHRLRPTLLHRLLPTSSTNHPSLSKEGLLLPTRCPLWTLLCH